MKTTAINNIDKANELKREVENWVDRTFNFILLQVYEKMTEGSLFEYIEQMPASEFVEEWFNGLDSDEQTGYMEKFRDDFLPDDFEIVNLNGTDLCEASESLVHEESDGKTFEEYLIEEYEQTILDWANDSGKENYPVWSTLFEFRHEPSDHWLDKAKEQGIGVIKGMDCFNATLFMTSAGHSFYSAYWIPLYLSIFSYEAEKYKDVDYSMM